MTSWPILPVVIFLPLLGALFIMAVRGEEAVVAGNARWTALWFTLGTFVVSLFLLFGFDPSSADFQFEERAPWAGGAISFHLGVDGISLPFVILTPAFPGKRSCI